MSRTIELRGKLDNTDELQKSKRKVVKSKSVPLVAIVILNCNGLQDTTECLQLLRQVQYDNFWTILVDNGSANDQASRIENAFHEVEVIRNSENEGFCKGNNIGANLALQKGADYILFLNNDTTVEPDFLEKLVSFAESNPDVGICGPLIYYYYEKDYVYSSGGKFNQWLLKCEEFKHSYNKPDTSLNFLSGCAFMVRKEVVEKVGLWDEDFFKYWEETDYCLRARSAGYKIACVPDSVIYHKVARTNIYLSIGYVYYMVRNNLVFAAKHGKWFSWPLILVHFVLRRWFGYGVKLVFTRNFASLPGIFWGTVDFVFQGHGKGRF